MTLSAADAAAATAQVAAALVAVNARIVLEDVGADGSMTIGVWDHWSNDSVGAALVPGLLRALVGPEVRIRVRQHAEWWN